MVVENNALYLSFVMSLCSVSNNTLGESTPSTIPLHNQLTLTHALAHGPT